MSRVRDDQIEAFLRQISSTGTAAVERACDNEIIVDGVIDIALALSAAFSATPSPQADVRPVPTSDEVEKYREARGPEWSRAYDALREFHLSNIRDEDGYSYPLVDLMTRDGVQITDGEMELVDMLDTIFEAIRARAPETNMQAAIDQAVAIERERCARIAEGSAQRFDFQKALADNDDLEYGRNGARIDIARAIRDGAKVHAPENNVEAGL